MLHVECFSVSSMACLCPLHVHVTFIQPVQLTCATKKKETICDVTSIPGFVIKKNSSRGPKQGVSERPERQVMFYKAKQMLKKGRQGKRGNLLGRYVQKINNANEKINKSKEEKTSITMSIGKLDGSTTESHGETRRQRLHLQHRSGKTHKADELELMVFHIV